MPVLAVPRREGTGEAERVLGLAVRIASEFARTL